MVSEEGQRPRTALVLSGGGARGAYEVGVVQGILEVLGPLEHSPFDIFTGTSVGAINTAYFASRAHRRDMGIERLVQLWTGLTLLEDLEVDMFGALGWGSLEKWFGRGRSEAGPALLRAEPLEDLIRDNLDWDQLHQNINDGLVRACIVAALRMDSGQTTLFAEMAPGADFTASRDPRRTKRLCRLSADHVLASAAIPFVFPPRFVDGATHVDGGLRFNTPLSPALRSGAQRVLVISTRFPPELQPNPHVNPELNEYGADLPFLLGKMLSAIMLDPIVYDLQVLERFNRLLDILESTVDPETLEKIHAALAEIRGVPYERIRTLVVAPSEDSGHMASQYSDRHGMRVGKGLSARLKSRALRRIIGGHSDAGSFLLFDGRFLAQLIELGRQDALARRTAIKAFFDRL